MVLSARGLAWLVAALLCASIAGAQQPVDWSAAWTDLARARAAAPESAERGAAVEALERVARERRGDPRGELLRAHLDLLAGEPAAFDAPAGPPEAWPFEGEELWLVAEVLAPSPARARAARRALESVPGAVRDDRVQLAWRIGLDEARALRLESARDVQDALHRRYAAVWSAMDLALTETRLGAYAAADRVLDAQIAREAAAERPTADLWSQRGTLALAMGDEARARDYLGHGVARGSSDAAVVLARLDLEQGRLAEARAGFRALLLDVDPSPWAARGFGVAWLPEPSPLADQPAPERN